MGPGWLLLIIVFAALGYFWLARRRLPRPDREGVARRRYEPFRAGELTVPVGGSTRSYHLHLPARLVPASGLPLVLAFHGGLGNGPMFALGTGMSEAADRHGFAVAYPNALGGWADGREGLGTGRRDLDFVDALVDHLISAHRLDSRKVYAVGVSNGGMFVLRLASERSSRFAAYAAVLASMPVGLAGSASAGPPVPLLLINATEDPLMPYGGGQVAQGLRLGAGGEVIGAEETVEVWRVRNRCAAPRVSILAGVPDGRSQYVEVFDFPATDGGADLRFVKIHRGGHSWPRLGRRQAPERHRLSGEPNDLFEASDLIWRFVSRHARDVETMRGPHAARITSVEHAPSVGEKRWP